MQDFFKVKNVAVIGDGAMSGDWHSRNGNAGFLARNILVILNITM